MKNKVEASDTYEHLHFWVNPADAPAPDGGTVENLDGIVKVQTTVSKPPTGEWNRPTAREIILPWREMLMRKWLKKPNLKDEHHLINFALTASGNALKAIAKGDADRAAFECIFMTKCIMMLDVEPFEKPVQQVQGIARKFQEAREKTARPEEVKQAALARFDDLYNVDPHPKKGTITAQVCEEFGVAPRTLDDWRAKAKKRSK